MNAEETSYLTDRVTKLQVALAELTARISDEPEADSARLALQRAQDAADELARFVGMDFV